MFLPGWDEIMRLKEQLMASRFFGTPNRYLVLPLHSMIAKEEQRKIFIRPARGIRKVTGLRRDGSFDFFWKLSTWQRPDMKSAPCNEFDERRRRSFWPPISPRRLSPSRTSLASSTAAASRRRATTPTPVSRPSSPPGYQRCASLHNYPAT